MQSLKKLIKQYVSPDQYNQLVVPYHWLRALAANVWYRFPARKLRVIAVTGTNGKTTTLAFLVSILEAAGHRVGVSTTAFFKIGDEYWDNELNMTTTNPFALQRLLRSMKNAKVDFVLLEVTSHALAQHRVFGVPIEAAVLTNITQDHLDYHRTMKRYARAKGRLFKKAQRVIALNRDDEWFDYFNQFHAPQQLSYGADASADCRVVGARLGAAGTKASFELDDFKLDVNLQLPGKFNVYNALAAAAVTYGMDIDKAAIKDGLEHLKNVPGRLEAIDAGQPFNVFVDYAHTPDALKNLFETVNAFTKGRLIAVYGATGDRDRGKRPIMGEIGRKMTDVMVLTDDEPYTEDPKEIISQVKAGAMKARRGAKVFTEVDRKKAIAKALSLAREGDSVVITGMGHQKYRVVGREKKPWDEREIVRSLLANT